tara:strand:- start:9306 stop:9977 length:672 start_codon:yes stop_codon:yes gene_type:complete
MAHIHFVSAHFGGPAPWTQRIASQKHKVTTAYYTDQNTPSRHLAMHPRLKAKIPKMLEWRFMEADWYVWLDSSIKITSPDIIEYILQTAGDAPLCLFRHSYVNSIAEESKRVRNNLQRQIPYISKRYSGEPILEQIIHYYGDSNFRDENLFGMTFFAYHRSAAPLMQEWFNENVIWTIQDQLSFPYVLQKSGMTYSTFDGYITDPNPWFCWDWQTREQHLKSN